MILCLYKGSNSQKSCHDVVRCPISNCGGGSGRVAGRELLGIEDRQPRSKARV